MANLQIGELAKRFNVSVETIRYYEKQGLLPPPSRNASNYRHYTGDHLKELGFILNCRSLDMRHDEIKTLLRLRSDPAQDCDDVNALFDAHIAELTTRMTSLRRLLKELRSLRASCCDVRAMRDCNILGRLTRPTARRRKSTLPVHSRRR